MTMTGPFPVRYSLVLGLLLVFPVAAVPEQEMPHDISGGGGLYGSVSYVATLPANTQFGVLGGRISGGRATNGSRQELSFGYHLAPVKEVSGPRSGSGPGDARESTIVMTRLDVMGGVYCDFGTNTRLIPYIGVGAGVTFVGHTRVLVLVPLPALQGAAGIGYAVTEAMHLTLGYRMHGLLFPPLLYHQVEAGVRFRF